MPDDPFQLPRSRILPWNVGTLDDVEKGLLQLTGKVGALWPVGRWSPSARPVILVHGIHADFGDLQPVIYHYQGKANRQVMVYAYDDKHSAVYDAGLELAVDLMRFRLKYAAWATTNIVAHSMGGLISRWALNELTAGSGGIGTFSRINFLAMDTPWHGFPGPGLPLPGGSPYEDLQARSRMFNGFAQGSSATRRAGLYGIHLPGNVRVQLCSANNQGVGDDPDWMLDYTDIDPSEVFDIHGLTPAVIQYLETGDIAAVGPFSTGKKIFIHHYLEALVTDTDWPAAEAELRQHWQAGDLVPACLVSVLGKHLPRFAGDHSSVLGNHFFLLTLDKLLTGSAPG